jgi:hypothetical protein
MTEWPAAVHRVLGLLTLRQNVIDALLGQLVERPLLRGRTDRSASLSRSDDPFRRACQVALGEVRS